jgi:glutathione synthase/RimK-type ligase-like ATP-grasp enzyme
MLLILTGREDATASYLSGVLLKRGLPFLRLDTENLISRAAIRYTPSKPALRIDGRWYEPAAFSHVWYRRPEKLRDDRFGESPEGQYVLSEWAEAFEGFFAHVERPRWMNYPAFNAVASHKLEQLSVAAKIGFTVPDTLVTQEPDELRAFYERHAGAIVVKPMATAYVSREPEENDSLIYTNRVGREQLSNLDDLTHCPTLFQQLVSKECDVRITVVDARVRAVRLLASEDGVQRCDIRRNNMNDVRYEVITLPPEVETNVQALMQHYGLRFGAIDMVVTQQGTWYFLEINPNGQWAWLDLCAKQNIAEFFVESFSRAMS